MGLTVLKLASWEKKDRKKEKMTIFAKIIFRGFYKFELKSKDIFVLRGSGLSVL